MKYIDLFAGVGGFRYGIDNAMEWLRLSRNKKEQVQVKDEESRTDFSRK